MSGHPQADGAALASARERWLAGAERAVREILAGDGSLAEKAKQAKEEVIDRDKSADPGESSEPDPRPGD